MSKTDKTDDQQAVAAARSGSAAEQNGNAVREAANKTGDAAREAADKSRDVAHEAAEKGREVTHDVVEQGASAVEQTTERSEAAFAAAADHAGIWCEFATAQLAHNVEAFQKLAAARSWPEQLAIQQGFLQGNVERLVEATSRSMARAESMVGQRQPARASQA